MNIIIPLGRGSRWQNNELRYCLRSIEANLTGWEQIFLIGEKPDWLKTNYRLVHLPFEESAGARVKESNINRKILHYCQRNERDSDFLFMNDDHFILKPINAPDFPTHYKGALKDSIEATSRGNRYIKTLSNTLEVLKKKGVKQPMNYDTHAPIIYNIGKYIDTVGSLQFPCYGYGIKTMYCELNRITGERYIDCKPLSIHGLRTFFNTRRDRLYFSIGNIPVCDELQDLFEELYPVASCWE